MPTSNKGITTKELQEQIVSAQMSAAVYKLSDDEEEEPEYLLSEFPDI